MVKYMSRGAQFLNDQMVRACVALTGFEMTERGHFLLADTESLTATRITWSVKN